MNYKTQRNLGLIFCPYAVPYKSLYFCIIKFAKKTRTNMRDKSRITNKSNGFI